MMTFEKKRYKCYECQKTVELQVRKTDFIAYQNGAFVQDAFPYLSDGDHELMISGICTTCFDEMFDEDE